MTKAYSIRIYGRVFNVGFRRYVHRYGLQCHVVGYVENDRADGSVHIEAEGKPIIKIGIAFSKETKTVSDWIIVKD